MHMHVDYPKGLANMKHLYVIGNGFDIAHLHLHEILPKTKELVKL